MFSLRNRITSVKEESADERGLVIVEAAFIYPIVIVALVLVMAMSEMYYQRANIEALTLSFTQQAAGELGDTLDFQISDSGDAVQVNQGSSRDLYRYLLGTNNDFADVETRVNSAITGAFTNNDIGLFGPAPTLDSVSVEYRRNFTYEELHVSVDYSYRLSMFSQNLVGSSFFGFDFNASAELPVLQSGEFIRNFDLANDTLKSVDNELGISGLTETFSEEVCRFVAFFNLGSCGA